MIKAKVFDILDTFSKEDFEKFGQFINSDYFNSSLMIRNLYIEILKFASDLDDEELTRELLFEKLYPGKNFREGTIVNLLSGLYKLIQEYISFEIYKKETFTRERNLLRGLNDRRLDKYVLKSYELISDELNSTKIQDENYFFNRQEIEGEYVGYLTRESFSHNTEAIQNWHDMLIDYVMTKTLSAYVFMQNQVKFSYNHKFRMNFIDHLISFYEEGSFKPAPSVSIRFNLMMLLKEDDEQYYFKLKELLKLYPDILDDREKWNLYICMANFCDCMVENANTFKKFTKESFELYKEIVGRKIYKAGNRIPFIHHLFYINVVRLGLIQNEFEWTEDFISNYEDELSEEYRSGTFNMCRAMLHFSRRNYEKSLELLAKVRSQSHFFLLSIKALTLQIYYELDLFENAFLVIDSYKHYLKDNHDIRPNSKTQHRNFASVVSRLLKIKSGGYKFNSADFNLSREEFTNIIKIDWLQEKIEEVKNS